MRRKAILNGFIVLIVLGVVSTLIISLYCNGKFGGAYIVGALLGIVNGVLGFLTIERFVDKRTLAFLRGVFLGMGIRLVLLLGVFILLLEVAHIDVAGMVSGLLIFYFTMTVLEVIFLNKRMNYRNTTKENSQ